MLGSVLGSGHIKMSDTEKVLALWKLKGHSMWEPIFEKKNQKDLPSNLMKHNIA